MGLIHILWPGHAHKTHTVGYNMIYHLTRHVPSPPIANNYESHLHNELNFIFQIHTMRKQMGTDYYYVYLSMDFKR